MKLVITGDWHLDRMTAGFDRFDDVSRGIDATIFAAIKQRADLYVFLGDLANPHSVRSHRAAAKAIESAIKLRDSGIESLWIVGNHDVIEDGSCTSTLSALAAAGFVVASKPMWMSIGTSNKCVVALPHPAACAAYDPAEQIGKLHESIYQRGSAEIVLVAGHLSLPEATQGSESGEMARGRGYNWPVDEIKKHWPSAAIIGGHYHRGQSLSGVTFAGSLERLAFDEAENDPGFLMLEV